MSAADTLATAGALPLELVPAPDGEMGGLVASFTRRRGHSRLLVNVDQPLDDQLAAIADCCRVLAGERSDWCRRVRHLQLVPS